METPASLAEDGALCVELHAALEALLRTAVLADPHVVRRDPCERWSKRLSQIQKKNSMKYSHISPECILEVLKFGIVSLSITT